MTDCNFKDQPPGIGRFENIGCLCVLPLIMFIDSSCGLCHSLSGPLHNSASSTTVGTT